MAVVAVSGMAQCGASAHGWAVKVWLVKTWLGKANVGKLRQPRQGEAQLGWARHDLVWLGSQGGLRRVKVRCGPARTGSRGKSCRCKFSYGVSVKASCVDAGKGSASQVVACQPRQVKFSQGEVRLGNAWQDFIERR